MADVYDDMKTLWKTTGNFCAPEDKESEAPHGDGFDFTFAGPDGFEQALKVAEKFARFDGDCPKDFTVEFAELVKGNRIYA